MRDRFSLSSTLWELFVGGYKPMRLRGCSSETVRQYKIQVDHFSEFLGHIATVGDLDDLTVANFLDDRSTNTSRANSNKARNHVLALWRFAARKGIVVIWPDVEKLSEPERVPQAWTDEQIDRLFAACAAAPGNYADMKASEFWLAVHWLLWNTGERKGALLAIETTNLDLQAGTLIVPAETRKGGRKAMIYFLWPETIAAIAKILDPAQRHLFRGAVRFTNFYGRYRSLLKSAGLPVGRFCGPHRMRKSVASHLKKAGGDPSAALGHDNERTTKKHYIDPKIATPLNQSDLLRKPQLPPEAA